jgi:hypothetical protein
VYGDFGHAQTDLPKTMLVGGADNPAIKVFGYGAWLRDNDLTDLSGAVERMSDKMVIISATVLKVTHTDRL